MRPAIPCQSNLRDRRSHVGSGSFDGAWPRALHSSRGVLGRGRDPHDLPPRRAPRSEPGLRSGRREPHSGRDNGRSLPDALREGPGLTRRAVQRVPASAGVAEHASARARSLRAAEQERRALSEWGGRLTRLRAPRLLPPLPDDEPLRIRTEWLAGSPLDDASDWRDDLDLARTLGAGLAELHGLAGDDDPMPLSEAIPRRLEGWLARDDGALAPFRDSLRAAVPTTALARAVRVPCHRDVGPENVLVRPDGGLALIDWEHARLDHPWTDALRTWQGLPPDDDPWLAALAEGMELDPRADWPGLRALGVVEGAGCVVWGTARRDRALQARGWLLLGRLTDARGAIQERDATESAKT